MASGTNHNMSHFPLTPDPGIIDVCTYSVIDSVATSTAARTLQGILVSTLQWYGYLKKNSDISVIDENELSNGTPYTNNDDITEFN